MRFKQMPIHLLLGAMICFLSAQAVRGDSLDTSDVVLTIKPDKLVYRSGEPILIELKIQNEGRTTIVLPVLWVVPNYFLSFRILNERGDTVKCLQGLRKYSLYERDFLLCLPPKGFVGQTIDLIDAEKKGIINKGPLYEIGSPGEYRISAIYSVFKDLPTLFELKEKRKCGTLWTGLVTSNTVSIKVIK